MFGYSGSVVGHVDPSVINSEFVHYKVAYRLWKRCDDIYITTYSLSNGWYYEVCMMMSMNTKKEYTWCYLWGVSMKDTVEGHDMMILLQPS